MYITVMTAILGQFIHAVRKKAKLSQKELADLAGIGKTTVFDIENGKSNVRFDNIQKVCRVLSIRLILKDPLGNETEVANAE